MKVTKIDPRQIVVKQTSKGGTNNLRCKCGGVVVRDSKGGLKCPKCGVSATETKL